MNDEQVSWKGHGFTLLVFGGIVFLCSIFFVLGMLVGRGQEQRAAKAAASIESAKLAPAMAESAGRNPGAKSASDNAAYEVVETGKPKITLENALPSATAAAVVSEPAPPVEVAKPEPPPKPPLVKMLYLQVIAVEKESTARKQQDDLMKQGFSAVISSGTAGDKLFRVQVGPFATVADREEAKTKLQALGYSPINPIKK